MSELSEGEKDKLKSEFQIDQICLKCDNYKKDCKGYESLNGTSMVVCGNGRKFKRKQK